jgi:hypothetical protein
MEIKENYWFGVGREGGEWGRRAGALSLTSKTTFASVDTSTFFAPAVAAAVTAWGRTAAEEAAEAAAAAELCQGARGWEGEQLEIEISPWISSWISRKFPSSEVR